MLPRNNRLKKRKDFQKIMKEGKGLREDFLFLKFLRQDLKVVRVGFIVSAKVVKKATQRNEIKRKLREGERGKLAKLRNGYDLIFEMDADFSHDPVELPNFVKAAENADLVLGSRYVDGIRITNWPISRLILSKGASLYVRFITGIPATDPTGGYKCYSRKVLETIGLDGIVSSGYSFQVEMSYKAWMLGFSLADIPITFVDRRAGYSKMNGGIFKEGVLFSIFIAIEPNGIT